MSYRHASLTTHGSLVSLTSTSSGIVASHFLPTSSAIMGQPEIPVGARNRAIVRVGLTLDLNGRKLGIRPESFKVIFVDIN